MSKNYNYMDSIYNMINSPEIEEDDIVYLDEPEDEYFGLAFGKRLESKNKRLIINAFVAKITNLF